MFAGHELNISKTVKAEGAGVFLKVDFLIKIKQMILIVKCLETEKVSQHWQLKKISHLDAQPLEGGKLDWARQDLLGFRIQLEEDNVEEGGHEQNSGGG